MNLTNPSLLDELRRDECLSDIFRGGRRAMIPLNQLSGSSSNELLEADDSDDTLKDSIIEHGLIESLIVREIAANSYEVICGNRRMKALQGACSESTKVPCRIIQADDDSVELLRIEGNNYRNKTRYQQALEWWQYDRLAQRCKLRSREWMDARAAAGDVLGQSDLPSGQTSQKQLRASISLIAETEDSETRNQLISDFNDLSVRTFYQRHVSSTEGSVSAHIDGEIPICEKRSGHSSVYFGQDMEDTEDGEKRSGHSSDHFDQEGQNEKDGESHSNVPSVPLANDTPAVSSGQSVSKSDKQAKATYGKLCRLMKDKPDAAAWLKAGSQYFQ